MALQPLGQTHSLDFAVQRFGHEVQQALVVLHLLLGFLLLLLGLQSQIVGRDVLEVLLVVGLQHFQGEFVHVIGEVQNFIALVLEHFRLRQLGNPLHRIAAGIVDAGLAFLHAADILFQGYELLLAGRVEQNQIFQHILMHTVIGIHAVFQLETKALIEFLVLLTVIVEHGFQLGLDLLFQTAGNQLELAVMLEHFTADIQRQVLRIHQALDKAEIVGQQVGALFHNHHAIGIQLETLFIFPGIEIHGSLSGNEQQRVIGCGAFGMGANHTNGVLPIHKLLFIEVVVFLVGDLTLVLAPDRHHAVQGFGLGIGLKLHGSVLAGAFGLLLRTALFHIHTDGVADIVGIFFDDGAQTVLIQILVIVVLFGIILDVQGNHGTVAVLFTGLNGIPLHTGGVPAPGFVAAIGTAHHGDIVADHKGGVEAHAELADNIDILLLFVLLLEVQRTALGDDAQIVVQLVFGHTHAVIGDSQGTLVLVGFNGDGEIIPVQTGIAIFQGAVIKLVNGVAGVGDQLAEKDFLMGIDGIDHHIQQAFGFCLKLLHFHRISTSRFYI